MVIASASSLVGPAGEDASDSKQQQSKRRSSPEFGNEKRRATDVLLVLNAACLMLQWLSKGMLTFWGAKVRWHTLSLCMDDACFGAACITL